MTFNLANGSLENELVETGLVWSTQNGFLEYVPVGKKGILVAFGGYDPSSTISVPISVRFSPPKRIALVSSSPACFSANAQAQNTLNSIQIYDIDSATWYTQATSGNGVPPSRQWGCSVMKAAPDKSSYNIYIQGGTQDHGVLNSSNYMLNDA